MNTDQKQAAVLDDDIAAKPKPRLARILRRRGTGVQSRPHGLPSALDAQAPAQDAEEKEALGANGAGDAAAEGPTDAPRVARRIAAIALPALALVFACGAGYLKYQAGAFSAREQAATSATGTARDVTAQMLSYGPVDTEAKLTAASDRMAGAFRDSYRKLITDVVAPGAKEKQITATASVPAAAVLAATPDHAEILVFVNQAIVMAKDPPTSTTSVVQVSLDRQQGRWMVTGFEPK